MRCLALVLVVPLVGCGSAGQAARDMPDASLDGGGNGGNGNNDSNGGGGGGTMEPPTFQIVSPNLDVRPGADVTFCFYFQTSNTADVAIKRWVSRMSPGVQQTILYLAATPQQPPGTLSSTTCGPVAPGGNPPAWIYSARTANAEAVMPSDDGEGHPVGYVIHAGQPGFLQMHYINDTTATIHAHVELDAYAYADGVQVTPAGTFATYLSGAGSSNPPVIKPGSPTNPTQASFVTSCGLAQADKSPKFFAMTTQTFKQGVHTAVKDGDKTIFESTSWAQPGSASWNPPTFYTFTSGKLTYQCDYMNPTNGTITFGDDPAKNENCMAVGYYFPLVKDSSTTDDLHGHFCFNQFLSY